MTKEKQGPIAYENCDDMHNMVIALKGKHPEAFFMVDPTVVKCLLITNRPQKKGEKLAKIQAIRGINKELTHYRYVLVIKADLWDNISEKERAFIVSHELMHIHIDGDGKLADHDIQCFKGLLRISNPDFKYPLEDPEMPNLLKEDVNIG